MLYLNAGFESVETLVTTTSRLLVAAGGDGGCEEQHEADNDLGGVDYVISEDLYCEIVKLYLIVAERRCRAK